MDPLRGRLFYKGALSLGGKRCFYFSVVRFYETQAVIDTLIDLFETLLYQTTTDKGRSLILLKKNKWELHIEKIPILFATKCSLI